MIRGAMKVGRAVLLLEDGGIMNVAPDHKRWSDLALGVFPPDIPEDLSSQKRIKEIALQVSSLLAQVQEEQRVLRGMVKSGRIKCPVVGMAAAWTADEENKHGKVG